MSFIPRTPEPRHRLDPKSFIRTRKLPLHRLVVFVLNLVAGGRTEGMDIESQRFFRHARQCGLWPQAQPPSRSAVSRRRALVPWQLFADLLAKAVALAEELWPAPEKSLWRGLRVLAIDGSHFNLPATAALRQRFDPQSGLEHPGKGHFPQCLVVTLYDVLRRVPLARAIVANNASEREQAEALLADGDLAKSIVLFDRGFPGYDLLRFLLKEFNGHFLMRCPATSTFGEIARFARSAQREAIVTLRPPDPYLRSLPAEQRQSATEQGLVVRAIRLVSLEGEVSVLLTDLLDGQAVRAQELTDLYFRRWKVEEYYREEKVVMDVEAFHGRSENAIRQELFAAAIMTVIARLLGAVADHPQPRRNGTPQHKNALLATADHACLLAAEDPRAALDMFEQLLERIACIRYHPPRKKRPPQPRVNKTPISKWAFGKKAKLAALQPSP